jgi:hypothetical protein
MARLNHQGTLYLQKPVELGDLILLPRMMLPSLSESLALQKFGVVNFETSIIARNALMKNTVERSQDYYWERMGSEDGKEPAWIEDLPLQARMWLRYDFCIHHEEPLAIINNFPHTGLWYMVREGGLCDDLERLFGLRRLQGVKQLGFLQQPWTSMDQQHLMPLTRDNRYVHSLDVHALTAVMAHNLGLSRTLRNTVCTAGFTHDWLTPAGGDSVKFVDSMAFDEDFNYAAQLRHLPQDKWEKIKKKYAINEHLLCEAILNRGLLGEILDIADKLAYVGRDLLTCLEVMLDPEEDEAYVGTRALHQLVKEFPYISGIWDAVKRKEGHAVFDNEHVWRLIGFLKARIVLFRELYYHPRARFGEYLISRVLVKMLYNEGNVDPARIELAPVQCECTVLPLN